MDMRKIIAFGKSSFVISLPKEWLTQNNLKKGDAIYIDQEEHILKILPEEKEREREEKRVYISVDGKDVKVLEREISAAYVNYTSYLVVQGKDLPEHIKSITRILQNLLAVEIVEQSHTKLIARDFLRIKDISIKDYLHKADITVRSMIADLENESFTNYEDVIERQRGVKRIHLLILKMFKAVANDPSLLRHLQLPNEDFIAYQRFNFGLLYISLELTRIAQWLEKGGEKSSALPLIHTMSEDYLELMRCLFHKDKERALRFSKRRDDAIEVMLASLSPSPQVYVLLSSLERIHRELHEMAHQIYD